MSQPHFKIRIAGSDLAFDNPADDTLLRAGLRAGVGLPYECSAGGCAACKFELLSGEVDTLWAQAPGLNDRDRAKNRHLACQCRPLSDLEIKVRPSQANLSPFKPMRMQAEYLGSRAVTADMQAFEFRGPGPAQFVPGQYALLQLPGEDQARAYSMSNQPNDAGVWQFIVRKVPGGRISNALFDQLKPGQTVSLDGPLGLAHWRPAAEGQPVREVLCIAGGSGLAPMLSVANQAAASLPPGAPMPWLFYGGRGPQDIPRFSDWLQAPERVQVRCAVSVNELADAAGWTGERGLVHELVLRTLGDRLPQCEIYLAGPPPMIDALTKLLMVEMKVPAAQIHFDRFF